MHPSAYAFASTALTEADVKGKQVVEAGAYNYNGTVRGVYEAMNPASYLGTDAQAGPGVDLVCPAEKLAAELGDDTADVVICTEMLEHAADWQDALAGLAQLLAPAGLLVLTTRGPGFPYHPHPDDFWRFTKATMEAALDGCGLEVLRLEDDPDPSQPGVLVVARKPEDGGPGVDMMILRTILAGPAIRAPGFYS